MIMHNKNRLITESQYHRRICLLPLIASSMLALWYIIMTIKTSVEENRMMFDYTDPMDLMVIIIGVSFLVSLIISIFSLLLELFDVINSSSIMSESSSK